MFNTGHDFLSITIKAFGKLNQWLQLGILDPGYPFIEVFFGPLGINVRPEVP